MTPRNLADPNVVAIDQRSRKALDRALSAGAHRSLLSAEPFLITKHLKDMTVASKDGHKRISRRSQFESYRELWEDPFFLPYIFCISSAPSEVMAQQVALRLFLRATSHALKGKKNQPLWHPVYGGISHDRLRDDSKTSASLLILTNVPYDATPYKLEKLRDILTKYSAVPRVVVTSDESPIDFMTDKLKMPVNFAMYLGAKKEKRL